MNHLDKLAAVLKETTFLSSYRLYALPGPVWPHACLTCNQPPPAAKCRLHTEVLRWTKK